MEVSLGRTGARGPVSGAARHEVDQPDWSRPADDCAGPSASGLGVGRRRRRTRGRPRSRRECDRRLLQDETRGGIRPPSTLCPVSSRLRMIGLDSPFGRTNPKRFIGMAGIRIGSLSGVSGSGAGPRAVAGGKSANIEARYPTATYSEQARSLSRVLTSCLDRAFRMGPGIRSHIGYEKLQDDSVFCGLRGRCRAT